MTTITAVPNTDTASVLLEISTSSPVQKILRNDANGVSEVRALQGQLPTPLTDNEFRRNLCINPSAETNLTGYTVTGGTSTITRFAATTIAGSFVTRATWTTAPVSPSVGVLKYEQALTGKANLPYLMRFRVRSNDEAVAIGYTVEFLGSSGQVLFTISPKTYYVTFPNNQWGVIGLAQLQCPVDFARIRLSASTTSIYGAAGMPKNGFTFDFDALLIEQTNRTDVATIYYFDGSTDTYTASGQQVPGTLSWTGTPHASQSIIKNTGTLIITDYEAAAGINTYSVIEDVDTGATANAELVLDNPWLLVPILPNYSEKVRVITNYGAQRQAQSTVHSVIGRADPLMALGVLGSRTGSLEIFCESLAQARTLETVFNRGEIVMLKQNVDGMDMYFSSTSTSIAPYSPQGEDLTRYSLSVQYTEVKRPVGNLAGALGWTFDELARSYATFNEVLSKFATFNDLTIRKEK